MYNFNQEAFQIHKKLCIIFALSRLIVQLAEIAI